MAVYYNEIDPYAAQWLRNLIAAGHIAKGDVDERNIKDVTPNDIKGYTQCHFFAGIGGWSYALRLAKWSDEKPVWTGSCPCQPFSSAGRGVGLNDERHLWPHWHWLITKCRPHVVFGEQVDAAIKHGWLDLVQADMEAIGYAFGAAGIPAAGIGAPHVRQRLWFVADRECHRRGDRRQHHGENDGKQLATSGEIADNMAYTSDTGRQGWVSRRANQERGLFDGCAGRDRSINYWSDADWLYCRDKKYRPVEPSTFPLAHGIPNRVGRLRAYGNAIVPQVAAEFIRAYSQ